MNTELKTKIKINFAAEKQADVDRVNQFFTDAGLETEFTTGPQSQKGFEGLELVGCVLTYVSDHPTLVPVTINTLIQAARYFRDYRSNAREEAIKGMWVRMMIETESETQTIDPHQIDEFIQYLENELPDDLDEASPKCKE